MERITVKVSWDDEDGTLDDLENETDDGYIALLEAATAAAGEAKNVNVSASREDI